MRSACTWPAIRAIWRAALGDAVVDGAKGALLYLTKYVSQHPPGEPHFFVKPFALTQTPPGWSCLLEGLDGDGSDDEPYDVWRGVVRTDAFHATPAVFHLWRQGVAFVVPEGRPLLRAIPLPRSLQTPRIDIRFLDGVGPWIGIGLCHKDLVVLKSVQCDQKTVSRLGREQLSQGGWMVGHQQEPVPQRKAQLCG